jgi:hypothetical protein
MKDLDVMSHSLTLPADWRWWWFLESVLMAIGPPGMSE